MQKNGMTWIFFLWTSLMALFFLPGTGWVVEKQKGAAGGSKTEKYHYEAFPTDHQASQKTLSKWNLSRRRRGIGYYSKVISPDSLENISIQMDQEGRFISGTKRLLQGPDRPVQQEKNLERSTQGCCGGTYRRRYKRKEYRLPPDKELAVDGSLLARLRFFPFGEGKKWDLFMVDFSGYSITVTVLQEGREKIAVPAGEFDCYRLVAVVNIPVLKPKIRYWLWTQKPNFLVKHQGKRGPFTPSYTTSLVSFE